MSPDILFLCQRHLQSIPAIFKYAMTSALISPLHSFFLFLKCLISLSHSSNYLPPSASIRSSALSIFYRFPICLTCSVSDFTQHHDKHPHLFSSDIIFLFPINIISIIKRESISFISQVQFLWDRNSPFLQLNSITAWSYHFFLFLSICPSTDTLLVLIFSLLWIIFWFLWIYIKKLCFWICMVTLF